jgi:hypothetical protein
MKHSHYYLALLVIISYMLYECLKFGNDVELSGQEVNDEILAKVTRLTGVIFPEGTEGRNYLYYGSGIDDALSIKVFIPAEKEEEFLENTIFSEGENKESYIHLGKEKNWWKLDSLTDPTYTIYNYPNGNMIECTMGEENGKTVVYMSWITV